jgi:hypothetical protein
MPPLYPLAHFSLFVLEWILLGLAIRLWRQSASIAMIVLPILLASISYDNLVLALGHWIGSGTVLQTLSFFRYILHFCAIPLFVVVGVELADHFGLAWATRTARWLSWGIAIGLIMINLASQLIHLNLVPINFMGVLRYTDAAPSGPPIITILVNLLILYIGAIFWSKRKWPWLFIGTLISVIGNAIPIAIVGTIIGSTSECLMALSLLLTEQHAQTLAAIDPNPR